MRQAARVENPPLAVCFLAIRQARGRRACQSPFSGTVRWQASKQ